jgi:hypothetical protein
MSMLSQETARRVIALLEPRRTFHRGLCGDCRFWMTPRCPREQHSNVTGRWTGPASLTVGCDQWTDRRP